MAETSVGEVFRLIDHHLLVGGWATHLKKYARQITWIISPGRGETNMFETTT